MRGKLISVWKACLAALLSGTIAGFGDTGSAASAGKSTDSEAPFLGIFYDLKQTQDRKPTNVDPETYSTIVDDFLSKGWDETVLNRYYRVTMPMHTTQVYITTLDADSAPQDFGVEKLVRGTRWVVHYKAQVSAPEPGTYRFWGIADDVMAVAVNGKTVLVGNRRDTRLPKTLATWQATERDGAHAGDGSLRAGDWITLKQDEIIDLDVMLGDRPGGVFNAFMMVEKQGASYNTDRRGHPILPIFQIAPYNTPPARDAQFATGFPVWKSYQ